MDEAHEALSGPAATQKILYREYYDFGDGAICAALDRQDRPVRPVSTARQGPQGSVASTG